MERASFLSGLGVVLLAATTAGCGRGEAAAHTEAVAPRASVGGTLRLFHEAPRSLDPVDVDSVYDSLPVNQLFDGLVALNPGLNVVPALAETWTISRDGKTYTFRLRPGVRFHDGSPLTSEDVVFTFRRALAPRGERENLAATYLSCVAVVEAVDPLTVTLRLSRPYPTFLEVLALDPLRVVPKAIVEEIGAERFRREPVGTGPFRFRSWSSASLELEANPDYFRGRPGIDAVRIVFPDPGEVDAGLRRFESGEVDAFEAGAEAVEALSGRPDVEIYRYQELSLSFLGLLSGRPPLDDPRIRQAIAHAIDREAIAALSPEFRRPAIGILPPGLPGYSPQPKVLRHDVARARGLLAEAGYPGGRGLSPIPIHASKANARGRRTYDLVRAELAEAGIPCTIVESDWADLSRRVEDHDAPGFMLGWIADIADPDAFLTTLFAPQGASNYFDFADERAGKLMAAGGAEANPIERARIYREIERRILDLAPIVPLYHSLGTIARRSTVRGLDPGPLGLASVDLENVRLVETRP